MYLVITSVNLEKNLSGFMKDNQVAISGCLPNLLQYETMFCDQ